MFIRVFIFLGLMSLVAPASALTAEDVLGDYKSDPLFGVAAAEREVVLELLHRLIWPKESEVRHGERIRIKLINKSKRAHAVVFSTEPSSIIKDKDFQAFVKDDLMHASLEPIRDGQHTHADLGFSAPKAMVKKISDHPVLTVRAGEFREMIVEVDVNEAIIVVSVSEEVFEDGYVSSIFVVP